MLNSMHTVCWFVYLFSTFLSDSAEVIQSRLNEQEGREEFYVHYVGCELNCIQIPFVADHTVCGSYRFPEHMLFFVILQSTDV